MGQDGYLSLLYDDNRRYAIVYPQSGRNIERRQARGMERYPEFRMTMNPNIDPSVHSIKAYAMGICLSKIYVSNIFDKFPQRDPREDNGVGI